MRVLDENGVPSPHVDTSHAALKRARAKEHRGQLAGACTAHATRTRGTAAMVLDDVTTLHFEVADEDDLRRVGMSTSTGSTPRCSSGSWSTPRASP